MQNNDNFTSWLNKAKQNLADAQVEDKPFLKTALGTWLMAASPTTAEALSYSGFDFLVVDMEHVPIEFSDLAHILRAISCGGAKPVVRLAWNDPVLVKRALDAGAQSLMLPFIQNAKQAKAAADSMRYPPHGSRGVAGVHRGSHYGTIPGYLQSANEFVSTIVQLETPQAIENLPEIAAVEGIDALFVGPGDLSASMGYIGQIDHQQVQGLIEKAAIEAHRSGKPIGIVGPNPDMVKRFMDYGYDFVAIASDIAMMTGRAGEWLAKLHDTSPKATIMASPY